MSLLELSLEAGIPGDTMWSLIDDNHIVSVPQHDGLLVEGVDDGLDDDIDGMAAGFAMQKKEVTPAALDRIMRVVKHLSELVRKMNDRQTCFESEVDPLANGEQGIDLMPGRRTTQ